MTRPQVELVAAVAANGVIGRGGQLPWHLPDDLRHFKTLTLGHPVIMGRRTFESLVRPLPGRRNIVVSRTLAALPPAGVEVVASVADALRLAADHDGPIYIVGGAAIYAAALPGAQIMHLTELDDPVAGDTYFPNYDRADWQLTSAVRHERDARHAIGFRFCTYARTRRS
jgi:dihydrofolate reductase